MGNQQPKDATGFFFGLLFVIAAAIAATVLMANDRKNLNRLLAHYGFEQTHGVQAARHEEPADSHAGKTAREPHVPATAPSPGILRPSHTNLASICAFLAERGLGEEALRQAAAGRDATECVGERIFSGSQGEDAPQGSLFSVVRGKSGGEISAMRIKILAPAGRNGEAAHRAFQELLDALAQAAGWSALQDIRAPVSQLRDTAVSRVDMAITFRREPSNPDAYNLIVRPQETNARKFQSEPRGIAAQ